MFRIAKEEDTKLILEFIYKLAEHEGRTDMVFATEETLRKWIFDKQVGNVIFLMKDGKEIGMAIYYFTFSTFKSRPSLYIEDLFVDSEYRGGGYGKKIINHLAKISLENDCRNMKWTCLKSNESSIKFYDNLNAEYDKINLNYSLGEEELNNLVS